MRATLIFFRWRWKRPKISELLINEMKIKKLRKNKIKLKFQTSWTIFFISFSIACPSVCTFVCPPVLHCLFSFGDLFRRTFRGISKKTKFFKKPILNTIPDCLGLICLEFQINRRFFTIHKKPDKKSNKF